MYRRVSRLAAKVRNWRLTLEALERRDVPSFVGALSFQTGGSPVAVAAGDFNSDGVPDLTTANTSGTMSVLFAAGDGTFGSPTNFAVGSDPRSVGVADLNGDGHLDVATVNFLSSSVSLHFGNGDGTFQTPASTGAGFHAHGLAMADFDGDSNVDMAVTDNAINGGLAVLLNDGNGEFFFTGYAVGANPNAVVANGDFNSDGIVDLAILGGNLHLVFGNGDGTFQPSTLIGAGFGKGLAATDLHGDGFADIIVGNNTDTISVLRGKGDGTFDLPKVYPAGKTPTSLAAANIDGDGDVDIVVGNFTSTITVLRNQLGSLRRRVSYAVGDSPSSVAVSDFNNDGEADVATANKSSNAATVALGIGGGAFAAVTVLSLPSGGGLAIQSEDIDSDGILDLAIAYESDIGYISTYKGAANGAFTSGLSYPMGDTPGTVITKDLNGDGFPDIAVENGYATVLIGGPAGFPVVPVYNAGFNPDDVAVGDFNEDGVLDLVVPNLNNTGTVSLLLGNADGSFGAPTSFASGSNPSAVGIADFNGDGNLDVAAAGSNLNVLLGNGDGTFQATVGYNGGGAAGMIVVDDFSSDGILDVALAGGNTVRILINNGSGAFLPPIVFTQTNMRALSAGDFNNDGRIDLVTNSGSNPNYGLYLRFGNGNGTFAPAVQLLSGSPRDDVDVADINGDGRLDIVSPVYPNTDVLLGNGDGTFSAAPSISGEPSSLAVDDLDGDGHLDLVTVHDSLTRLYRGNGDGTFEAAVRYVAGPDSRSVAVADFNGDGLRDIAVVSGGAIRVLIHQPDGTFPAAIANPWASCLDAGDFDGDGLLDLATGLNNSVRIYLAVDTLGIYPTYQSYAVGDTPRHVAIQDFNNDGELDVVTGNNSGTVSMLLGNGDGTFHAAVNFYVGTQPRDIEAADFNADGNADLLIASTGSPGSVRLLFGNGDGTFQLPVVLFTETGPVAGITTADLNNDGKLDFAVVAPGAVGVRLGNGDGSFQAPLVYAVLALGLDLTVGDFNGDGFVDIAAINKDNIAILFNSADWPPLPIGDGPRLAMPLDVNEPTELVRPALAHWQTFDAPSAKPVDVDASAIGHQSKYASRHIVRVAHARRDAGVDAGNVD